MGMMIMKEKMTNNRFEDFKELVLSYNGAIDFSGQNKRVLRSHILDLWFGIDPEGRNVFIIKSQVEPMRLNSSKFISVKRFKNKSTNIWNTCFVLENNNVLDLFITFCFDLIESTKYIKSEGDAVAEIGERYLRWQELLAKKGSLILSQPAIKGLIGELLFLYEFMVPKYGTQRALESWCGPMEAAQDFIIDDTWYEIKSIQSNSSEVEISSLEQLDQVRVGQLVINRIDRATGADMNAITLNEIVDRGRQLFGKDYLATRFNDILSDFGYVYTEEYNYYQYIYRNRVHYCVNNNFPCLRKSSLPNSILRATYTLDIPVLTNFEVEI